MHRFIIDSTFVNNEERRIIVGAGCAASGEGIIFTQHDVSKLCERVLSGIFYSAYGQGRPT